MTGSKKEGGEGWQGARRRKGQEKEQLAEQKAEGGSAKVKPIFNYF
jgi:hypothetical protein